MKNVRAILIDPFDCSVSYVEYPDTLKMIYELLQCSTIDAQHFFGDDYIYFDDEGKLKNDQRYFQFKISNPVALCGRCLILGTDDEGGNANVNIDIDTIIEKIEWLPDDYKEEPFMKFIPLD